LWTGDQFSDLAGLIFVLFFFRRNLFYKKGSEGILIPPEGLAVLYPLFSLSILREMVVLFKLKNWVTLFYDTLFCLDRLPLWPIIVFNLGVTGVEKPTNLRFRK